LTGGESLINISFFSHDSVFTTFVLRPNPRIDVLFSVPSPSDVPVPGWHVDLSVDVQTLFIPHRGQYIDNLLSGDNLLAFLDFYMTHELGSGRLFELAVSDSVLQGPDELAPKGCPRTLLTLSSAGMSR
jgi:hypothetical protein